MNRNGIIFRGESLDMDNLLDFIKVRSWNWIIAKINVFFYFLFYGVAYEPFEMYFSML